MLLLRQIKPIVSNLTVKNKPSDDLMGTGTCRGLIQAHTKAEKSEKLHSEGQLALVTFCSFGRSPKPCEAGGFRLAAFLAAFLLLLQPSLLISPLSPDKLLKPSAAQLATSGLSNHAENP